jgi:CBS domain-containing protein
MTHLLPVLMTVLIAASVGNFFTASVYDTLLREKGLPYIPAIKNSKLMKKTVGYVMNPNLHLITTDMTYHQLQKLLKDSEESVYPLVNNHNEKIFLCQIQRFALERHLFKHELAFRNSKMETDSEEDTSDEEEYELAANLKKIHISIDDDIEKRKKRKKQERKKEKRDKNLRKKAKEKEQEEREREILRQNVQQHILQLQSSPGSLPTSIPSSDDPSSAPLNLTPQQIALASTSPEVLLKLSDSITESIIQSKKLKKPPPSIISREEFFEKSCGFDKLAKYLASHGVSQTEETIIPAVDGSKPTEAEGDNTGVDLCPYTVLETSPLSKVHFMFAVMGLSHIWVVREGRLVGLVAKEDLMNMEKE